MEIELWGVRGSLPTPLSNRQYHERVKKILLQAIEKNVKANEIDDFFKDLPDEIQNILGGNTTCVTFKSSSGKLYIIDGGTGIRALGDSMMNGEAGKGKAEINLMFTHTHWDHVQGIPFFKPFYIPGNKVSIYSPYKDLEQRLIYQQEFRFFPVKFHDTASEKHFHYLEYGKTIKPEEGLTIDIHRLRHPGGSFAYKFKQNGKSAIFCTDAEFLGDSIENLSKEDADFFKNADLLIIDAQYSLDDSFMKLFWGHTSSTMAVNCGAMWKVKHLVLTHHEPSYTDSQIRELHKDAIEHKNLLKDVKMKISIATEGDIFKL